MPPGSSSILAPRLAEAGLAQSLARGSSLSCPRRRRLRFQRLRFQRLRFHSHHHPPADGPFGPVDGAILAAAYRHVPEHGFSQTALGLGARDAGFLDISPSVLPDGAFGLIRYHLVTQRRTLASRAHDLLASRRQREQPLSVGDKVAALTWARLMANKDIIHQWQQALAIMAQPSLVPASLKELALLSDDIWFLAGDEAVDPSWYSKRAFLSAIYSTTELFMTNDKSPDFAETSSFLGRRLAELQTVGATVASLTQLAGFTMNASINVLRSKGLRI